MKHKTMRAPGCYKASVKSVAVCAKREQQRTNGYETEQTGVDAKYAIEDGLVKVNGNVEYQRGKKLHDGDEVTFQGETIRITL